MAQKDRTRRQWLANAMTIGIGAAFTACGGGGGGGAGWSGVPPGGGEPPPGGGGTLDFATRAALMDALCDRYGELFACGGAGNPLQSLRDWARQQPRIAEAGAGDRTMWTRFTDGRYFVFNDNWQPVASSALGLQALQKTAGERAALAAAGNAEVPGNRKAVLLSGFDITHPIIKQLHVEWKDKLVLHSTFGSEPGTVSVGGTQLPVTLWNPDTIELTLPTGENDPPGSHGDVVFKVRDRTCNVRPLTSWRGEITYLAEQLPSDNGAGILHREVVLTLHVRGDAYAHRTEVDGTLQSNTFNLHVASDSKVRYVAGARRATPPRPRPRCIRSGARAICKSLVRGTWSAV
ncbi:hypothetical protein J2W24_003146 [Variovorax boronicumulans]|uniref:hypothetical protein n=1 Tax=Variovorax boronicumulans TaxID=436515 RepID=UPI0027828DB0|nr:hypothetical protein [Variovorax boronicumulans]MDP9917495.1 hypothetical protein [Variovorax boronicumulans]